MPDYNTFKFFKVTFPAQFVAHVEINRAEKLNAFSLPLVPRLYLTAAWTDTPAACGTSTGMCLIG